MMSPYFASTIRHVFMKVVLLSAFVILFSCPVTVHGFLPPTHLTPPHHQSRGTTTSVVLFSTSPAGKKPEKLTRLEKSQDATIQAAKEAGKANTVALIAALVPVALALFANFKMNNIM